MESSNDDVDNQKNKGTDEVEGKTFNWTNDYTIVLLELCLAFVAKNGRNQLFKWRDIAKDFEARTNRKVNNYKSLKNKYDQMKRDWRIWKGLKQSETGLGWDYITGKLDCSNEWWEIKIKEKPEAKKFRNKGVPRAIEELWDQLYSDVVANGLECVTPAMNPSSVVVNDVQSENVERVQAGAEEEETNSEERVLGEYEDTQDHVYSEYSQYSSRLENLERSEGTFWHEFSNEVLNADNQQPNQSQGVTQVPISDRRTSKEPQKNATKTVNSVPMKRKRRQSTGLAMMNHHLENMVAFCGRAVQALESDASAPDSVTNTQTPVNCAVMVMNVLKNMDGLENGSALWCYAIYLLEDAMRRDFFFAMEDDASRLAWLKFMYDMKDK